MSSSLYGNAFIHTSLDRKQTPQGPLLFAKEGAAGVPLGNDPKNPDYCLPWWPSVERGHGLFFSATGGGKNTNIITPALLTYTGSVFCLDVKGENAWITADRRRQLGQRVVILDPWNRVNEVYGAKAGVTEQISRFNPLSTLDPNSLDFADDLALIADAIIVTPPNTNPHWTESASDLICGLAAASVEKAPGVASFRDVRDLLTAPDAVLGRVIQGICEANPSSLAARKLGRFVPQTRKDGTVGVTDEISSIRSTAITQTAIFDAGALLDSMDTDANAFDLADLVRQRVSVFVVLPPNKLLTHGRWMRLIIQLALRAIADEPTPPPVPCLFLLDELGTINPGGGLRMIEQCYGLAGSMGIRIWSFFQTLGQLQRDYPGSWQDMVGNSEVIQFAKVNDRNTANYLSNHIGTSTWTRLPGGQWKPSKDGKIKTSMKWANNTIVSQDSQMASRPAILPQDIMELGYGEVVTLFQGKKSNFRLPTLPYFKEPRFNGMYRPNPLFPAAPVAQARPQAAALSLPAFLSRRVMIGCAAAVAVFVIVFTGFEVLSSSLGTKRRSFRKV